MLLGSVKLRQQSWLSSDVSSNRTGIGGDAAYLAQSGRTGAGERSCGAGIRWRRCSFRDTSYQSSPLVEAGYTDSVGRSLIITDLRPAEAETLTLSAKRQLSRQIISAAVHNSTRYPWGSLMPGSMWNSMLSVWFIRSQEKICRRSQHPNTATARWETGVGQTISPGCATIDPATLHAI